MYGKGVRGARRGGWGGRTERERGRRCISRGEGSGGRHQNLAFVSALYSGGSVPEMGFSEASLARHVRERCERRETRGVGGRRERGLRHKF